MITDCMLLAKADNGNNISFDRKIIKCIVLKLLLKFVFGTTHQRLVKFVNLEQFKSFSKETTFWGR